MRNMYKILENLKVGNHLGDLGKWEDFIKWTLKKLYEGVNWIHLAQNSVQW
jgi:hypothetical protein